MASPRVETARSITDFSKIVEDYLQSSHTRNPNSSHKIVNWYRGVGSVTHSLEPGLYWRKCKDPAKRDADELLTLERRMLVWFRQRSFFYPQFTTITETTKDLEYLFFMQHYGVPTRLLDWSENPFMGLYFAVTSAHIDSITGQAKDDVAVWFLDPTSWNSKSLLRQGWDKKGVLSLDDPEIKGYVPRTDNDPNQLKAVQENPSVIYGVSNSARMVAQKGVFTIFGRNTDSMEAIYDSQNFPTDSLMQGVIPKGDVPNVLNTVTSLGFTESVAYPDLQGLALEIKRSFGFQN